MRIRCTTEIDSTKHFQKFYKFVVLILFNQFLNGIYLVI